MVRIHKEANRGREENVMKIEQGEGVWTFWHSTSIVNSVISNWLIGFYHIPHLNVFVNIFCPSPPHSSLLTPHSSLLTPHSSLLTPHSSLLTLMHTSLAMLIMTMGVICARATWHKKASTSIMKRLLMVYLSFSFNTLLEQ